MSTTTVERPTGRMDSSQRMRDAIIDGAIVAERNLVSLFRVPTVLVFELVQPVMFTLLFRYVFGGAIADLPKGLDYVVFLMPGIFVQNAIFGATTTAIGIADDMKKGMVDRFRSLPMSRSAMLIGRTTADLVKNFIVVMLMVGVGYLIGFRFHNGFFAALGVDRPRPRRGVLVLVDLGGRRPGHQGDRGGPGGRVHVHLPGRVHEHGVRAAHHHAGLAPGHRQEQPRLASGRRPPGS